VNNLIRVKPRPLQETIPFAADETKGMDIPMDNNIRAITVTPLVDLTKGTTAATGAIPDGLLNLMKKLRLVMNGDDNKFNVDAVKHYKVEAIEKGISAPLTAIADPAVTVADSKTTLRFDFAKFRQDLRDISALLPAPQLSSLRLECDWGSIADLYGTVNDTIVATTTKLQITLWETVDDEGKSVEAQAPNGKFQDIRESVGFFDFTEEYSQFDADELAKVINPVPSRILTHFLLTREDYGGDIDERLAVDDVITRIKIQNVKGNGEQIFHVIANDFQNELAGEYGIAMPTGGYYIDWRDPRNGLDNFVTEALKWKFLTNAPDSSETDRIEVYTRYIAN